MKHINGTSMTFWYDADAHADDGNGWCYTYTPGSVTYRVETFDQLLEDLKVDAPFINKFLTQGEYE